MIENLDKNAATQEDTFKVSVVIPAYCRPELLEKAVRSCIQQDLPGEDYEIIVVDSSPTEDNLRVVEALQAEASCELHCFRKTPEGPGPSRNYGAKVARAEILAFMDSDCQASPGWLSAGLNTFEKDVGLVQGQTTPEPGAAYHVFNRSFTITSENCIYQALNIFYRRQPFLQQGGFLADEDPRALKVIGGEDVDLAWKIKRSGWHSLFSNKAAVTHIVEVVTPWEWLFDKRMLVVPRIVKDFPETRCHFFANYFFNKVQASFTIALLGLLLSIFSIFSLLLMLPYAIIRGGEHTRALPGPLRIIRVFIYFPKDFLDFIQLFRGSLRYKAVLL